jgi:hypothetical protein
LWKKLKDVNLKLHSIARDCLSFKLQLWCPLFGSEGFMPGSHLLPYLKQKQKPYFEGLQVVVTTSN